MTFQGPFTNPPRFVAEPSKVHLWTLQGSLKRFLMPYDRLFFKFFIDDKKCGYILFSFTKKNVKNIYIIYNSRTILYIISAYYIYNKTILYIIYMSDTIYNRRCIIYMQRLCFAAKVQWTMCREPTIAPIVDYYLYILSKRSYIIARKNEKKCRKNVLWRRKNNNKNQI